MQATTHLACDALCSQRMLRSHACSYHEFCQKYGVQRRRHCLAVQVSRLFCSASNATQALQFIVRFTLIAKRGPDGCL